jgi:cytochrome P450
MAFCKSIPRFSEPRFAGSALEFGKDRLALLRRVAHECGDIGLFHAWGRPIILLNKAEYVHAVLSERATDFERMPLLPASRATFGEGLLGARTRNGDHARQRKMLQLAFQSCPVSTYPGIILDYARRVEETWEDGQTVSIRRELERITVGVAGAVFLGVSLDCEVHELREFVARMIDLIESEIKSALPLPLWMPTLHNRRVRQTAKVLDRIICGIIQKRRQNGELPHDFLSLLLAARYEDGRPLSDLEVRDQVTSIFLPGCEMLSVSLTWTWSLLARHPHVYDRVLGEVDGVLAGLSPTIADLEHLPYTLQVFKETLRLYSPSDILFPRVALRDLELDGYRIRRGTRVIVSPHLLHRKPEYFPDPEIFEPERFSPENEKEIPRHAYFPFGSGQHVCIRKHFALLEAHLLLAAISQRVQFDLVEGQDIQPRAMFSLHPKNEIKMIVHRRATPSTREFPLSAIEGQPKDVNLAPRSAQFTRPGQRCQ